MATSHAHDHDGACRLDRDAGEQVADRLDAIGRLEDVDVDGARALVRAEPVLNPNRAPGGPTRTKTIQNDYQAEFYRRWRRVRGLIRETVYANDALGLRDDEDESPTGLEVNDGDPDWWRDYVADRRAGAINATPVNDFDFEQDGEKIDAFLDWLQGVFDDEVLEVRRRTPDGNVADREPWQNVYVNRAYERGLKFANQRLREAGVDVEAIDASDAFARPIHAETLSRLYTRNFRELEGITAEVSQQISRRLTEGLAKGWNPRKTADKLNDRVDKVGYTRSKTLARTETIYAHSEAALDRYESQGTDEVAGKAEWLTAEDDQVCEICEGLEGQVYAIDEARGLIPIHPNCRCTWLPVV
ncbi:MAG: minor capsid protein [Halobacteria archaeon]|nr:minor capsid protein [Halobacteria archaeon]